jgi:hypothetical protein
MARLLQCNRCIAMEPTNQHKLRVKAGRLHAVSVLRSAYCNPHSMITAEAARCSVEGTADILSWDMQFLRVLFSLRVAVLLLNKIVFKQL